MKKRTNRFGFAMFVLAALAASVSPAAAADGDDAMSRLKSTMDKLSKLKVSGYVQARWETGEGKSDTASVVGPSIESANIDRFYIRRARFKIKYDSSPTSSGVVYVDGGADRDAKVIEAYVTLTEPWTGERRHTMTFGQFTLPFGFENVQSSSRRELPERSKAQNRLFPGERDRGVFVTSKWIDQFSTTVGIFNGGGVKDPIFPTTDPTKAKDWMIGGRFKDNDMRLGATWYQGRALVPLTGPDVEIDRTRLGIDGEIGFDTPHLGGTKVLGELYVGSNPNPDSLSALTTASGGGTVLAPGAATGHLSTDFAGGYVMLVQNLGQDFQAVARYELFDPNADLDNDQFERYGLGVNYFWDKHTRITLAYDIPKTDMASGSGFVDTADNLWTLQFQHRF